jgi:hypothetical protein
MSKKKANGAAAEAQTAVATATPERLGRLLARSDRLYRAMFDRSPLPMWMFDRETLGIVAVNEAAIRHYGYSREEFADLTLADLRRPEDVAALRKDVRQTKGFAQPRVWRHRKKDGSEIRVEIRANDFVLDGLSVRLVLINDVTEREQAQLLLRETEEQLRHAQKMDAIGRLAGGVAHDFNNVLTVIEGYASILEDALADDPRQADAAEIRRAAERAAGITRQLLTLSRHGVSSPRSVDVDELITRFLPMLRRLVGEPVEVTTLLRKVPPVVIDPGHFEQVLMNLAVNARDAMPEGGRLVIETQAAKLDEEGAAARGLEPGRYVTVAVTDSGTGIDAAIRDRIFEPFFTTKDSGQGTGLGLSIVHGIASQAGGNVRVYSETGHGTTFRVHFPVGAEQVEAPESAVVEPPRVLGPLTVLVVDDDREVRTLAGRVLQEAGCQVLEAASAEEARRVCVEHEDRLDAAVLDVILPDSRGDALVYELRDLRPRLEVVLMSGYPAGALNPHGETPPNLLTKPFTPAELRTAVARAVGMASGVDGSRSLGAGRAPVVEVRPRVLLADDDPQLRRLFARILEGADFHVVEAASASQALAELEKTAFDVILSDVHMPNGGGLHLMRAVRRIDLDVPVILITGMPDVESASQAVEYGAFRYLTKPVDAERLQTTVRRAARAHALARLRRDAFAISGIHAGAADRAGLEVRFDQALEGAFMVFQPIVEASSGALFGIEALLRSAEPSMQTPHSLLAAAAQLGRLPLLGRRVRALCAATLGSLADPLTMFVNLHPEDLEDADLVDASAPLTAIGRRVVLEVTERASLDSTEHLTRRLARLRELGFRVAVDDIGAGYSGLQSFTDLQPEFVKIDMALVRNVHQSALKQRTIAALCSLCHEIGCAVVGEGVETQDERATLVNLGCDLIQGYLIARPSVQLPR